MVAGYVRLSRDDDKRNYVSIENQKIIIKQYAAARNITVDRWYEDDGVSGYSLNRPGFGKLMEDLDKDIQIIIAKDLSRIGRHNAKVLLLLDEIKERGKRLLLVDDDYDTDEDEDDIIGIKTWYNERYVKDTSRKIKKVMRARQKEGTLVSRVPFGYVRDRKDKRIIHVIEEEARYVRKIFELYLQGNGYRKIAVILTEEEVPTPFVFLRDRERPQEKAGGKVVRRWTEGMVSGILKNDFYIGNLRLHKRERFLINGSDVRIPKEEQLLFPKNHEAIILQSDFEAVQELMKKRIRSNYRGGGRKESIFGGKLICRDCKAALTPITRRNTQRKYYICSTYNSKGKGFCECSHRIEESSLVQDVITYIRLCRDTLTDSIKAYGREELRGKKEQWEQEREALITSMEIRKKELKTLISQKIRDISKEAENAQVIRDSYEQLQKELSDKIHDYEQRLKDLDTLIISVKERETQPDMALEIINHIIEEGKISREDVEIFIDEIFVDQKGCPEIILKYGLSDLVKADPMKVLNQEEEKLILEITRLIRSEKGRYISIKHLMEKLAESGYRKSCKSLLPYMDLMIAEGILIDAKNSSGVYEKVQEEYDGMFS